MTDVRGRTVLITGASAGLGAAVARRMAASGAVVVLLARRREALETVAEDIRKAGGTAHVVVADVGNAGQVAAAAAQIREAAGVPDVIVNNAGAGEWRFIEETQAEDAVRFMAAPYFGAYFTTHAFIADVIARGSGHIVNVNSPVSRFAWPGATGYAAARWAMRGFNNALRGDLRGTGVRVTHFICGEISSDYFDTNPGSRERIPKVGMLVPRQSPDRAAAGLLRAVRGNAREYVMPLMLRLFYVADWLMPRIVDWLVVATGHRRTNP